MTTQGLIEHDDVIGNGKAFRAHRPSLLTAPEARKGSPDPARDRAARHHAAKRSWRSKPSGQNLLAEPPKVGFGYQGGSRSAAARPSLSRNSHAPAVVRSPTRLWIIRSRS